MPISPPKRREELEHEHDIGRLSLPLVVIDLDTLAVLDLTVAAARLVGRSAGSVLGRPVLELLPVSDRHNATGALAALRDGLVDSFNTRRPWGATGWVGEGTTLWVRSVRFGDRRLGLSEISWGRDQRQSALVQYFGREPTDMAVGAIDEDWMFRSVSAEVEVMLGVGAEDLVGRSIESVVVADENLHRLYAAAARTSDDATVAVPILMRSTSSRSRTVSFLLTALAGSSTRGFIR